MCTEFDIDAGKGRLRTWCRTCTRLQNKIYVAKRDEAQVERLREYQRIWHEARRRSAGIEPRNFDYSSGNRRRRVTAIDRVERILLPPEPLLHSLSRFFHLGGTLAELSLASGVPERTIYRLVSGEGRHVRLDVADQLAIALGEHLTLLYPYEEEAA